MIPAIVNLTKSETHLKMQTLVTSVLSLFIRGLCDEEGGEYSESSQRHRKLI